MIFLSRYRGDYRVGNCEYGTTSSFPIYKLNISFGTLQLMQLH